MAKMPEIDTIGVQESSGTYAQIDESRRRATGVITKGLEAFGQELVKTQQAKAASVLEQGLAGLDAEIEANKTVSTKYVRDQLGDAYDKLPPSLQAQLTDQGLDLNTGEVTRVDKTDIPMWTVAGAIYEARSRKLLQQASSEIKVGGWQADFQDKVMPQIIARKARMNAQQAKDLDNYLRETQIQTTLERSNAAATLPSPELRSMKFAEIRDEVRGSQTMDPVYKEKLIEHVDKMEQVAPIYEALRREDYGSMAEQLGKLNDPAMFPALKPEERYAMSERLKAEIKAFQKAMKDETKNVLKAQAEAGWNGLFAKVRDGQPISYRDLPPPGTVPAEDQKQMIEYVDNKRKGVEPKTNLILYDRLTRLWRDNPEKFAQESIVSYINQLSPTDFKHFSDLQANPGSPGYDNVLTTDEAIDAQLFSRFKINAKKPDNDEDRSAIAHVKSLVQTQLGSLGHKPSLQERDDVIAKTLDSETFSKKRAWGLLSDKTKVGATLGVPPGFTVALREIHAQLVAQDPSADPNLSPENLRKTYQDFSYYSPDIERAWKFMGSKRRFTPGEAIRVYGYLKGNWGVIDAELSRNSKPANNANRAALAVQGYLAQSQR